MARIIDFRTGRERKASEILGEETDRLSGLLSQFSGLYSKADGIAEQYALEMKQDPERALEKFHEAMEAVRNVNPNRAFAEAACRGPNQDWTAPILNAVGLMYPSLDRDLRQKALAKGIGFLDGLNSTVSQDNIEQVNEPWLAADILINRPYYWPGFQWYIDFFAKNKSWDDVARESEKVRSDFWMVFTALRPKYSTLPLRQKIYSSFPGVVDRTLDAIAALIHDHSEHDSRKGYRPYEDGVKGRLAKYDPQFHAAINEKIAEAKWIRLDGQ